MLCKIHLSQLSNKRLLRNNSFHILIAWKSQYKYVIFSCVKKLFNKFLWLLPKVILLTKLKKYLTTGIRVYFVS